MKIQELIKAADDAYYATEYDRAILLYEQILELEPVNQHARQQIEKADLYRLQGNLDQKLPREAVQLYKKSRSYIREGNLPQASKLLRQAIAIANKVGLDIPEAHEILADLENILLAEDYKKKAIDALEIQQWAKAENHLINATNLDPTDNTIKILLFNLRGLLRANNLINQLNAGISNSKNRSSIISEIKNIIEITNETSALSTLWQQVVRLFSEYQNEKNTKINIFRNIAWASILSVIIVLIVFWYIYLTPRNHVTINCTSVIPGLSATVNSPIYITNGDEEEIEISLINSSGDKVSGTFIIEFHRPGTDSNNPIVNKPEIKPSTKKFRLIY